MLRAQRDKKANWPLMVAAKAGAVMRRNAMRCARAVGRWVRKKAELLCTVCRNTQSGGRCVRA